MFNNEEYILPCLNALLYVFLLAYAIMRRHGILIMISSIWLLCAVIGIVYSSIPFTETSYDITIAPYLYLFILFIIGLLPISKLRPFDGKEFKVIYNEGIVNGIVFVLAICSFIPFIESIIQIAFSGIDNLALNYEDRVGSDFDSRAYFSFIGRIFYSIEDYFEFLSPTFFFVYVTMFKERKMWIVSGLILALLNPLFNNLANGQRYYAVVFIYMILYNYLLFYKLFDEWQRKLLGQLALVVGVFLGLLFVSISLNRTSNGTVELGAAYQFVRYLGESMYNFNTDCYWITDFLGGEHSFKGFFSYFGISDTSIKDRTSILGIISNGFYTYIGAFVMDFGLIPSFILLSLLALLLYIIISKLDKEVNIGILIIISLYANILLFGTTYFIYENGFIHFVWAIFLAVFLLFMGVDNYESTETV